MKKKLNKTRHRKYDHQFNQEALKQVENGQSVACVDQALGKRLTVLLNAFE